MRRRGTWIAGWGHSIIWVGGDPDFSSLVIRRLSVYLFYLCLAGRQAGRNIETGMRLERERLVAGNTQDGPKTDDSPNLRSSNSQIIKAVECRYFLSRRLRTVGRTDFQAYYKEYVRTTWIPWRGTWFFPSVISGHRRREALSGCQQMGWDGIRARTGVL
jgi:hypothetical protein